MQKDESRMQIEENGGAMKFYRLAIGARFKFRGLEFEKSARGYAKGIGDGPKDHGFGASFMYETEVESNGPFLTEEEIGLWRPSARPWYERLSPAPPPRRESRLR